MILPEGGSIIEIIISIYPLWLSARFHVTFATFSESIHNTTFPENVNLHHYYRGAGASGLTAARSLSAAGWSVTVLEAANSPGGRILTLEPAGFSGYVEGGAEFIHGDLPISLQLSKEAGIVLHPVHSQMATPSIEGEAGTGLEKEGWDDYMTSDWDELMQKMQQLGQDQPLGDFLATYFPGERYAALRDRARRYAEGYDLADLHSASVRGLYKEWANEQEEEEYRPEGGYRRLVDYLVGECRRYDCTLHFSSPVAEVYWQRGRVEVKTASGQPFTADHLLVTVSLLGVLRADVSGGSFPAIPDYVRAASMTSAMAASSRFYWNSRRLSGGEKRRRSRRCSYSAISRCRPGGPKQHRLIPC